jgi:potassium intermediate/small conductance calcium-activated channel subfamily N protein 2
MYGCEANMLFAIRSFMKTSPFIFTSLVMGFSIVVFSQALRICEGPLTRVLDDMDLHDIENSIWVVILTMTTVGYGDYYPRTIGGRGVIFFCSITGVIIVSIVVVTVTNLLEMEKVESKAFTTINRVQLKAKVKKQAAKVIQQLLRLHMKTVKKKSLKSSALFKLDRNLEEFKKVNK